VVHAFTPGGLMRRPTGALARAHGIRNQSATSTNWSGYAVTGSDGAFNSVSSSWTEPAANCSSGDEYAAFWVGLDNSSAEVITEAPSSEFRVLPLADFGTVSYSGSQVNGSSLGGQDPTSITMVSSSGTQLDSTSAIDSNGDFSNTWLASGRRF
jgi:hypothetical protein